MFFPWFLVRTLFSAYLKVVLEWRWRSRSWQWTWWPHIPWGTWMSWNDMNIYHHHYIPLYPLYSQLFIIKYITIEPATKTTFWAKTCKQLPPFSSPTSVHSCLLYLSTKSTCLQGPWFVCTTDRLCRQVSLYVLLYHTIFTSFHYQIH